MNLNQGSQYCSAWPAGKGDRYGQNFRHLFSCKASSNLWNIFSGFLSPTDDLDGEEDSEPDFYADSEEEDEDLAPQKPRNKEEIRKLSPGPL